MTSSLYSLLIQTDTGPNVNWLLIFVIFVVIVAIAIIIQAKFSAKDAEELEHAVHAEHHETDEEHPEPEETSESAAESEPETASAPEAEVQTEPEEAPEPDAEPEPEAAPAAPPQPDDLKKIEGIGPKVSGLLNENGIITYAQLADTPVEKLQQILDDAKLQMMHPGSWPEQAQLAAEGNWDALQELQDNLKGGRR